MQAANPSTVLVWDVPTRLFHWTLLLFGALAWVTGEGEGSLFVVHKLAGYGVAVLLLFRVVWGFAGSRHSRFADFVRPWREVLAHIKAVLTLRPARTLGHNPLGGWMALVLLLVLAAQVGTGLFASGEDLGGGPLAASVSSGRAHAIAELHEGLSGALLGLIGLHVLGVLAESLLTRDNLVRAMITGRKAAAPGEVAAEHPRAVAPIWLAAEQIKRTLEAAGFVVDLAHDGEEGHFLGDTEPYDAVVLDLGLPCWTASRSCEGGARTDGRCRSWS